MTYSSVRRIPKLMLGCFRLAVDSHGIVSVSAVTCRGDVRHRKTFPSEIKRVSERFQCASWKAARRVRSQNNEASLIAKGVSQSSAIVRTTAHDPFGIQGHVRRGFEAVREAFTNNFSKRQELGGACCAFVRGEKVVDLWGGIRNKRTVEPWEQDTMVVVHSATKGLAAMTLAIAHSRGWLDYDQRVCAYWPEFAQNGKERITVLQLLAHQAGLFAFDEPVDRSVVADLDRLAVVLARQKPAWEPGTPSL